MKNVFDITKFGAVSDGVTDCTVAIQKALDAAGEVQGCVTVPPGTYLTGELHMRAHTRLEGYSAWSFRDDGISVLKLCDENAECLLDITGAFGCSVTGISMNGARLGKNIHGILLRWDKANGGGQEDTPTIDDCRIGSFSGDGVRLEHIWCFSVRHSMLHRNGGAGLYIEGWDGFIIDNWFTANAKGGMLADSVAASLTLTGNRVEWNSTAGFRLVNGCAVNITGNYFDRTFGPAIWFGDKNGARFSDVTVSSNFFYRGGCPDHNDFTDEYQGSHILFDGASNITLTGNSFKIGENDGGGGSKSPEYGIVVRNSDVIAATSNVFKNGYLREKIVWDNVGDCVFENNLG